MMEENSDKVIVFMTCEGADEAERIARELLQRRKAACVSIFPRGKSFYWWKGEIESAEEHLLIAKTANHLLADLIRLVKGIHSYEVPEIVSLPIAGGSRDYLEWLDRELT